AIGGSGDNHQAGAVWIYTRLGNTWTQQGSKITATGANGAAYLGESVALSSDGTTLLAGADGDSSNAGAAWVFTSSGGIWTQQGNKLVGTGTIGHTWQGIAVALSADGNTALVGGDNDHVQAGATWLYTRSGGVWTQQGNKLVGTGASDPAYQGNALALSATGNTAIIGGFNDQHGKGAVWIFDSVSTAGIEEYTLPVTLRIFPNPNTGNFTIQASAQGTYVLLNELGQVVYRFKLLDSTDYILHVEFLCPGIYTLLGYTDKEMISRKVIIGR
ncbi:MAG TPA: T9SS type A sorting domain-containing protein, partial [Bacteroidia bacterium]|nr:T9SS type A sorting domain-containing protein [Bacteroidia bacterium]